MKHYWFQPLLIPFTLLTYVATLLVLPFYRPGSVRYYAGCLEFLDDTPDSRKTTIWGRPGGQSWGIRIIWYNLRRGRDRASLRVHERVHTLHGEWVNAIAHAVLLPVAWLISPMEWYGWAGFILLAQLAFGLAYGGHFLWHWARMGFPTNRDGWWAAYLKIWSEVIAYRVDDEFERGERPDAWGA